LGRNSIVLVISRKETFDLLIPLDKTYDYIEERGYLLMKDIRLGFNQMRGWVLIKRGLGSNQRKAGF
jgi:hypothetical protein